MKPTSYSLSLQNASWIDVNSRITQDNLPDRIPDQLSITNSSLYNLLNCPIGARGKIFQPEYGSDWLKWLQEPIDDITAAKMKITMIQAVARWEPRIILDYQQSFVRPDFNVPGYQVRIAGQDNLTKAAISVSFTQTV